MRKVYACLVGNWCCLNDDPKCVMGENRAAPDQWLENNAILYAPAKRETADTYYELDYVRISYKGVDYRINPIFIQIVTE